jgi:hypothetical protein
LKFLDGFDAHDELRGADRQGGIGEHHVHAVQEDAVVFGAGSVDGQLHASAVMGDGLHARLHGRQLLEVTSVQRERLDGAFVDQVRHSRRRALHDRHVCLDFDILANLTELQDEVDDLLTAHGQMQVAADGGAEAGPLDAYLVVADWQLRLRVPSDVVGRHAPEHPGCHVADGQAGVGQRGAAWIRHRAEDCCSDGLASRTSAERCEEEEDRDAEENGRAP